MAQISLTESSPLAFLNETSLDQSLGEDFSLCDNKNMVFHWADYHETCDAIKTLLEKNPELREEFKRKELAIKRLSLITVWIRTEKKIHQTTMFDLYEKYVLNQVQLALGVDPFGSFEISFISGTGPFRLMAITECFNSTAYKDFVMVYLLKDKLPKRDYRVRLKSKVLIEYGKDLDKASLIGLEQLTMNGLLFSLDADFYADEISKATDLRFLMDTRPLAEGCEKNLSELRTHLTQYSFNLMYSSHKEDALSCRLEDFTIRSGFDFLKSKKVYLFIPYEKLANANGSVKNIKNFVMHTRDMIREHYQTKVLSKSA